MVSGSGQPQLAADTAPAGSSPEGSYRDGSMNNIHAYTEFCKWRIQATTGLNRHRRRARTRLAALGACTATVPRLKVVVPAIGPAALNMR